MQQGQNNSSQEDHEKWYQNQNQIRSTECQHIITMQLTASDFFQPNQIPYSCHRRCGKVQVYERGDVGNEMPLLDGLYRFYSNAKRTNNMDGRFGYSPLEGSSACAWAGMNKFPAAFPAGLFRTSMFRRMTSMSTDPTPTGNKTTRPVHVSSTKTHNTILYSDHLSRRRVEQPDKKIRRTYSHASRRPGWHYMGKYSFNLLARTRSPACSHPSLPKVFLSSGNSHTCKKFGEVKKKTISLLG